MCAYSLLDLSGTSDVAVGAFLFLGAGSWLKVHSWLWNSQRTQEGPSLITQRLFRRRHASQGLSGRPLTAEDSDTRDPTGDVVIASGDCDAIFCIVPQKSWPVLSCSLSNFEANSLAFMGARIYSILRMGSQDRKSHQLNHSEVVEIRIEPRNQSRLIGSTRSSGK